MNAPTASWLTVVLGCLAAPLLVLPLIAPYAGLGAREDFILYGLLGFSRTRSVVIGTFLLALAAMLIAIYWRDMAPAVVAARDRCFRSFSRRDVLPPGRSSQVVFPRSDYLVIMLVACSLQLVYLIAMPIAFECDAAAYYNSAKAMVGAGGLYSTYRPPLYPLFLIVSGAIWPGTFILTVLLQAALGVAMPLIFYRCLYGLGRVPALIGTLALMVSTIPFTASNLILAEQLYMFLLLLAVMFLARYHDQRDWSSIYGFLLAGLGAMFTRWEAECLVLFGLIAFLVIFFRRRRHLGHVLFASFLGLALIGGYSITRAVVANDLSLIGSLQSGTGGQLLWRVYNVPVDFENAPHTVGLTIPSSISMTRQPVLSASNGPATAELKKFIIDYVRRNPESYRTLKHLLNALPDSSKSADAYDTLFGRFEGNPEALAENIFETPPTLLGGQYTFYMTSAVQRELGLVQSDRLLQRVGIETVLAHPVILAAMLKDAASFIGIVPLAFYEIILQPWKPEGWKKLFYYWGVFYYASTPFDAGGCATATVSGRMMDEYRVAYHFYETSRDFANTAVRLGSFGRNLVRAAVGGILVFGWWFLFVSRRRAVDLALAVTLGTMMILSGSIAAGVYSRYEHGILPLALMLAVAIATEAIGRFRALVAPRCKASRVAPQFGAH